ncbi:DUF1932 domain-containing protein [Maricaulis parjimensis]|uniref:DUF1932 domain-containing protein n=1 Tax=Maricaulis parjimensis TaxID=144023 RepID=UPI00193A5331|nr:NAD(P)-dependent oxidoreductase [Maricaulis parjimensis]
MTAQIAFIGFGEAARAFTGAPDWSAQSRAFDRLTEDETSRSVMQAAYETHKVAGCETLAEAVADQQAVISVVTADQALIAAVNAAQNLAKGTLYLDFNSVAPDTKRAAARSIEQTGAHYVDVAVMSPVLPKRLSTPLLVSGPQADPAVSLLRSAGFTDVRSVGTEVGRASAIKMIRSIMVKGREAISACCALAAQQAGVLDEIRASLGEEWADQANYNLDRMLTHGKRRAAEMDQVASMLTAMSIDPQLAAATAHWQRQLGDQRPDKLPDTLKDKLDLIAPSNKAAAE